jgi:uncharacterized protein with GYD domain
LRKIFYCESVPIYQSIREEPRTVYLTHVPSSAFVPHYILLAKLTEQGIRSIKDSPKRAENFERLVKKHGGEASTYYTLGDYDIVAVVKLPDDESMVRINLELGRLGNVRTTTLKAMTKKEMASIISSLKG